MKKCRTFPFKRSPYKLYTIAILIVALLFCTPRFPRYYLEGKTKSYAVTALEDGLYERVSITSEEAVTTGHFSVLPMPVTVDIFYFSAVKGGERVQGRFSCPRIFSNLESCGEYELEIF